MKLIRKLKDFPNSFKGGALTIGNFDGVHRGHASLIERLKFHSNQCGGPAVVFTFDPHPVRLLRPDQTPPPLTWTNRKADLLSALGVDVVIAYPTDQLLLSLTYQQFFQQIIVDAIGVSAIVEGPNFFFGKDRQGDVQTLATLCGEKNIAVEIVQPVQIDGDYISSSRIRKLLASGDVGTARTLLTRPYRIRGMVVHGAARGTKIGFPTANVDAIDTLVPADGVYAGRALIDGRAHLAAINIGPNPTFGEHSTKVEAHLLDFENSIYGRPIEVDFIERLRDIRQFESTEELKKCLENDIADARRVGRELTHDS